MYTAAGVCITCTHVYAGRAFGKGCVVLSGYRGVCVGGGGGVWWVCVCVCVCVCVWVCVGVGVWV